MRRSGMPLLPLAALTLGGCTDRGPAPLGPVAALGAGALPGTPVEGQVLIADQFTNGVIEVNQAGDIVRPFRLGPQDVSAASIIGTNDAERVGDLTLMAGTGAPPGMEPLCPNGCNDNRVLLVDHGGKIVWQYGTTGVVGAGRDQLNNPNSAELLLNGHILIADENITERSRWTAPRTC